MEKAMKYLICLLLIALYFSMHPPVSAQTQYVLLDPGHGGSSTGALSATGIREKVYTLNYGLNAYNQIKNDTEIKRRWKPFITRSGDTYVSLAERARIANNASGREEDGTGERIPFGGVHLFYSIHCNSGPASVSGTEVFWFDDPRNPAKAANSRNAASIALGRYAFQTFPEYPFAGWRGIKLDTQVHVDSLIVLRESNMPGILLETDFISNPDVAPAMGTTAYINHAGKAIAQGVGFLNAGAAGYVDHIITADINGADLDIGTLSGAPRPDGNAILFKNANPNFSRHVITVRNSDMILRSDSFMMLDEKVTVKVETANSEVMCIGGCEIFEAPDSEFTSANASKILLLEGTIVFADRACLFSENNGKISIGMETFDLGHTGFIAVDNGGTLEIGDDVHFIASGIGDANGYSLRLSEGATVKLGKGAKITVPDGARMKAEGTASNPITFTRLDPSSDWHSVELQGGGVTRFEWTVFEGGYRALVTKNRATWIKNSAFRDNTIAITTGWNLSGEGDPRTYLSLEDVLIEDSFSYGIQAYHARMHMKRSTIRTSGLTGLTFYDSILDRAKYVLVVNNSARFNSDREGLNILSGSVINWLDEDENNWEPGYNQVSGQPKDQLRVAGGAYLFMGYAYEGGGKNAVSGGSGYRIRSYSPETIIAESNWWGTASPRSGLFYGNVDYSPHLTAMPSQIPLFASAQDGNYSVTPSSREIHSPVLPMPLTQAPTEAQPELTAAEKVALRRQRIAELKHKLSTERTSLSTPGYLSELYQLHLQVKDDARFADDVKENAVLMEELTQRYKYQAEGGLSDGVEAQLGHQALEKVLLMNVHESMYDGDYGKAGELLTEYEPYITSPKHTHVFREYKVSVLDYHGDYEQALQTLDELIYNSAWMGEAREVVASRYEPLRQALEEASTDVVKTKSGRNVSVSSARNTDAGNTLQKLNTYALQPAYPNPFNPNTIVPFALPEAGRVQIEVFDITGRKVAVLANGRFSAGSHQVTFNADQLSSGVYIIKGILAGKAFIQKVTLIK